MVVAAVTGRRIDHFQVFRPGEGVTYSAKRGSVPAGSWGRRLATPRHRWSVPGCGPPRHRSCRAAPPHPRRGLLASPTSAPRTTPSSARSTAANTHAIAAAIPPQIRAVAHVLVQEHLLAVHPGTADPSPTGRRFGRRPTDHHPQQRSTSPMASRSTVGYSRNRSDRPTVKRWTPSP